MNVNNFFNYVFLQQNIHFVSKNLSALIASSALRRDLV